MSDPLTPRLVGVTDGEHCLYMEHRPEECECFWWAAAQTPSRAGHLTWVAGKRNREGDRGGVWIAVQRAVDEPVTLANGKPRLELHLVVDEATTAEELRSAAKVVIRWRNRLTELQGSILPRSEMARRHRPSSYGYGSQARDLNEKIAGLIREAAAAVNWFDRERFTLGALAELIRLGAPSGEKKKKGEKKKEDRTIEKVARAEKVVSDALERAIAGDDPFPTTSGGFPSAFPVNAANVRDLIRNSR